MVSFGQKLKMPKTCEKDSTSTLDLFYAKNGSKKQLIFEKWDHFENWQKRQLCKGHSLCKMVSLGQKLKMPETCDKRLYKHIRLVLCKKRLQKLVLRKKRLQKAANIWEMRPFSKLPKPPKCKGYSLCKMVTLAQKLKMPKTCDKRLYKHIRLVLCKKRLQKAANIWEMRPFWKLAKIATMQRL